MIRIVIIEDEKLIAEELQIRLKAISDDVQIVQTLSSVAQAVNYFSREHNTDLVLSDIQLPDGLSFDIFNTVSCKVPVIFITGFERFIINAFETNGIDYLLKPVDDKDLLKVLNKYKMLSQHFFKRQQFLQTFAKDKKRMVVRKGMMNVVLHLEDIVLFYTQNKIVYAIDKEGKKYLCDKNLTELEKELNEAGFFRVNRQYLLNAEYIKGYKQYEKVKLMVDLEITDTDHVIVVSQENAPSFRRWVNEI
ncbi:MAG: response regulator transcription factor [Bacteroidetes bacterium]|nr:response regulator transcription factor [Bacteroidota bacterium]